MTESSKIISEIADKVHITLTKNTKGYQWEISVYGIDIDSTLMRIYKSNETLNVTYGGVKND